MSALHEKDRELDYREQQAGYRHQRSDDREISLSTGTILALFFALALLCAVFFGFGYATGRKSYQPPTVLGGEMTPSTSILGGTKPSASNASSLLEFKTGIKKVLSEDAAAKIAVDDPLSASSEGPPETTHSADDTKNTARVEASEVPGLVAAKSAARLPVQQPSGSSVPATSTLPPIAPDGKCFVQVAAVSHAEDADVLLSALKKRGYAVFIRQEPQDRLLHVQVGPFADRKDADTMRLRLLSDGYNAIVK